MLCTLISGFDQQCVLLQELHGAVLIVLITNFDFWFLNNSSFHNIRCSSSLTLLVCFMIFHVAHVFYFLLFVIFSPCLAGLDAPCIVARLVPAVTACCLYYALLWDAAAKLMCISSVVQLNIVSSTRNFPVPR